VRDARRGDRWAREWLSKYLLCEPHTVGRVLHAHLHADAKDNPFLDAPADAIIEAKSALFRLEQAARANKNKATAEGRVVDG
jgi:hypothetical protein